MKIRVKTRDQHLIVRIKLSSKEVFDEKRMEAFSRVYIRGFLKPTILKKKLIEYSGPIGISLCERLKTPISAYDFFFIVEQIVISSEKITKSCFSLNHIINDPQNVYINPVTKEVQLIYLPLVDEYESVDFREFIEKIIYMVVPASRKDADRISKFVYFLKALKEFDSAEIEKYIVKVDRSVVNTIRKSNIGQSGFITNKKREYYAHYVHDEESFDISEEDERTGLLEKNYATGLLSEEDERTGLLEKNYATGLLSEEDERTGLLEKNYATGLLSKEDERTGLLEKNYATGLLSEEDERTGLLEKNYATGLLSKEDERTGLLEKENSENTLFVSDETNDFEDTAETALLLDNVNFPSLLRILTNEVVYINKPVFRIGKEKSYVDYFVMNNNAISRSHADIITRGNKYFVVDLNSKNHSYINNRILLVKCETQIFDGDILKLANEEFIFRE